MKRDRERIRERERENKGERVKHKCIRIGIMFFREWMREIQKRKKREFGNETWIRV